MQTQLPKPASFPRAELRVRCLPQVFRGVSFWDDVFNHENVGFWHYLQPAYNVMGFISCAGTNFLIRANAFAQAGWFPTHTLTEDYALGMEMRR